MTSVEYIGAYSPSHEGPVGPLDNKKLVVHKLVVFEEPRDSQVMPIENYEHANTTTISQTLRDFRGGSNKRRARRGNNGLMKKVKKIFT